MRWIGGVTLPRSIIKILTITAVLVSFSLAAPEPLRATIFTTKWLSERPRDPALCEKSDDACNSSFRLDSQRVFTPWRENRPGQTFYLSQFNKNLLNGYVSTKDAIILKLRI